MSLVSTWQWLARQSLDALLPPLCLACDAPVGNQGVLCAACWGQIRFIGSPCCAACGIPFDVPVGDGMLCGSCLAAPPSFASARAAMLYNDASRAIILSFKHGDRIHSATALASWMYRAGRDFCAEADIIMPVPLHRWRLFKRRYNQAALLAWEIGRLAGKKVLVDALLRQRATPIQGHLKRKERQANVRNAFQLNPRRQNGLKNKTIVLVDDVLTTGATVNECSRILLEGEARSVHVLTLARVAGSLA